MTSTQLNLIAPLATPLPPPREGDVLTNAQWRTLLAIADTVIPAVEVSSHPSLSSLSLSSAEYSTAIDAIRTRLPTNAPAELAERYFQETASSIPAFQDLVRRTLSDFLHEEARKGIRVILSALECDHIFVKQQPIR